MNRASNRICIRPVRPDDIEAILEADSLLHTYYDEDFDMVMVPEWALTEDQLMEYVRQIDSETTSDTRTYTVECVEEEKGENDEVVEIPWICGGFSYELQDDLYGLLFCSVNPNANVDDVVRAIADFLKGKAQKSGTRKEVRLWLRDCEEVPLDLMLPAWQKAGFRFKLVPDWFGDVDGWLGVYRTTKNSKVSS